MPKPSDFEQKFVEFLVGLDTREDRGKLAALRRGAGKPPGTAPEMFPILVPWTSQVDGWAADRLFLVGSLFALHPDNATEGNMGTTFARMPDPSESLEKRFVALLKAHTDDLPEHLRHAVALAESKEVRVNWAQLLADLKFWDSEDRFIQRQWAEQYWGRRAQDDEDETEEQ